MIKHKIFKFLKIPFIIWIALIIGLAMTGRINHYSSGDLMKLFFGILIASFIIKSYYAYSKDPDTIKKREEILRHRRKMQEFREKERIRAEEWHGVKREYEDRDNPFGDNPF